MKKAVFFLYLLILIRLIVFKYPPEVLGQIAAGWQKNVILEGLDTANFTLFRTIRMYIRYRDRLNSFENLFGNVAAFVPFGLLLPWVKKSMAVWWKVLANAFLLVLGIEVFQLLSAFGEFDVDDILLNCVGAMTGYLLFLLLHRCGVRENGRREEKKCVK